LVKLELVSGQVKEINVNSLPHEVGGRYRYAIRVAPQILKIHSSIEQVILFAGVADFKACETSDLDIAAIYQLKPYTWLEHETLLNSFRMFKESFMHNPYLMHLILLSSEDIVNPKYSTAKNIAEKGIILCSRI
jgi:predicted nucleotidyltransferase